MARCDEGYRCDVCGADVEQLVDSDLYLRYILGEVPLEQLHLTRERHLHCNPALTQYIACDDFPPVMCPGPFDKSALDPGFVQQETVRVTKGWKRLRALPKLGLAIPEYPLHITPDEELP
jgi:hypothetical protein